MILPAYLPESFGGAEQHARRLAQTLARRGVVVTLVAPRLDRASPARERDGPVVVRRFLLRAFADPGRSPSRLVPVVVYVHLRLAVAKQR